MAPFLGANGTPRGRRSSENVTGGPRERTVSRHREESAERFANLGRKVSGGVNFDHDFWQHVQSKAAFDPDLLGDFGGNHLPPRCPEAEREHCANDSAHRCEADWRQQQVDDFLASEAEKNQVLDHELEARRRRAETVVSQWAEDGSPQHRQSRRRRPSKPTEGMRQLEQQVADLRKRQAEQASILFAQEEKQRQKEEQTLRLLQQQAEELQWQQAEDLRLQAEEELRRQSTKESRRRTSSAARLVEPEDNESDEEERLGQMEHEEEKRRWQAQFEEDLWKTQQFIRKNSGEDDYVARQAPSPDDSFWRHSMEKENLGPRGMSDDSCSGWQQKYDPDNLHDASRQRERESTWSNAHHDSTKSLPKQAQDERRYSRDSFNFAGSVRRQESFHDKEDVWHQQTQEFENVRQQVDDYWRRRAEEDDDRINQLSEAERLRWLESLDHNLFAHARQREKDILAKEAAEEVRRRKLLEELRLQQEREAEEIRWQEQLAQEELRREAELQRQEALRMQELEEERRRHENELEELRRKEREYEEWRRKELEQEQRRRQELEREVIRRQELEQEQRREERRRRELEREERRRQKRSREKEEEARRLQEEEARRLQEEELLRKQYFSDIDDTQPRAFWDFEDGQRQQFSGNFEDIGGRSSPQKEEIDGSSKNARRDSTSTRSDKGEARQQDEVPTENAEDPRCPETSQEQKHNPDGTEQQSQAADKDKTEETTSPRPQSLYDVLKVDRSATEEMIRKAYKRQCMKHHPDKGGSRERFEEVGNAYQILSDKAQRKAYDQRGMQGVEQLRAKVKNSSQANAAAQEKVSEKAQPIVVEAYVPLEVAYSGGSVDVQVVRIAACNHCGGNGTAPGACYMHCPSCEGQGSVQQYVHFGHMIVEQRAQCGMCAGQGMVLPSTALCAVCAGELLVEEEVRVPFEIPPGVIERERLVAKGQGHAMPGLAAGDVTLVCRMQEHQRFYRKNNDLFAEQRVPLQVAICGGAFDVALLNGTSVRVRLPRGSVLAPGSIKCVPGEGMPKRQNPHLKGDLVLRFHVDFPESLSEDVAARLSNAFAADEAVEDAVEDAVGSSPSSPSRRRRQVPPTPDKQDGEVYLSDFDMEQFGQTLPQEPREAYEDDEEEEKARAAAKAAKAAAHAHRSSYSHFGGFVPPGGAPCRQM